MSEYTTTTEQVRSHYVFNQSDHWHAERGAAFDRWLTETLTAHGAEVRAQALTDPQKHADELLGYIDYCLGLPMYTNVISEFGQGVVETLHMARRTLIDGLHPATAKAIRENGSSDS